jgi:hypothetical protein
MMSRLKKLPPIHPGEILSEEFLKPLGMSMNKLADELHVTANRITRIVEGRCSITGETHSDWRGTSVLRQSSGSECRRTTISKWRGTSSKPRSNAKSNRAERRHDERNSRNRFPCSTGPLASPS